LEINIDELYNKAVDFHGHSCPGLLSGMIIGITALEEFHAKRAIDEEIVVISEGQSCMVDALQIVLGTTLGKGNLMLKDYGKTAATIFNRVTGRGYRFSFKFSKIRELLGDLRAQMKDLGPDDRKEFMRKIMHKILNMPKEEYMKLEEVKMKIPAEAQIFHTVICDNCKEGVMETRIIRKNGKILCISCAEGKYWI